MALTVAHHTGREAFGWDEIVEAMTTVESGTAVNIEYVPDETRAVAVHEAGHAVAAHAYLKGAESTRLSIRRRGGSLGHHMAFFRAFRSSDRYFIMVPNWKLPTCTRSIRRPVRRRRLPAPWI